jgi:RNA polymerase sigma-70 factor (ECF subfamily)
MLNERDQERFLRLWAEAQPAVAAFVHAVVRDSAAAKDLLQETALVLFRRFADYDGDRPFIAWALGVARFQVLGFQRDEARSLVTFSEMISARPQLIRNSQ